MQMQKMWSKRMMLVMMAFIVALGVFAQKKTRIATMYPENKTATVSLKDGKKLKVPNANVFLKNSSLVYFQGSTMKEANIDLILSVEFDDRKFVNIDNHLAYFVDSIKGNSLYCIEVIDIDSYERNLRNNSSYTYIDLSGNRLDTANNDMNTEEDYEYPVSRKYYYFLDGKFVQAHDRELYLVLDKERYRIVKTVAHVTDFVWTDPANLMHLLDLISK